MGFMLEILDLYTIRYHNIGPYWIDQATILIIACSF